MIKNSSKPSDGHSESPSSRPMTLRQQLDEILHTIPCLLWYSKPTPEYHAVKSEILALCQEIAREAAQGASATPSEPKQPDTSKSLTAVRREELWYEDRPIETLYFSSSERLRDYLDKEGLKHGGDAIAYCDTYGDEIPDKWGRLFFLNDGDLDSIVHECIHMASGIMAQKGHKSLDLTTDHATDLEEEFCALVGNLVNIVRADSAVTDLPSYDPKADTKATLRRKGQLTQKPPQPLADMQSDTSPKADSNQVDNLSPRKEQQ